MKQITAEEWKKKPSEYKTIIKGVKHILVGGERGATLEPVEVIEVKDSYFCTKCKRKHLEGTLIFENHFDYQATQL